MLKGKQLLGSYNSKVMNISLNTLADISKSLGLKVRSHKSLVQEDTLIIQALAKKLSSIGSFEDAMPLYHQLVVNSTTCENHWYGLGVCLMNCNKFELAAKAFNVLSQLSNPPLETFLHLAECHFNLGLFIEGEKNLDECKTNHALKDPRLIERVKELEAFWLNASSQKGA